MLVNVNVTNFLYDGSMLAIIMHGHHGKVVYKNTSLPMSTVNG